MKHWLSIAIALVAGIAVGALIFRGGSETHDHAAEGKAADDVWTCSMHPQVKAPKPGKCPICAMDLIPLSELGATADGRVFSMSESAKKLAGVSTSAVERRYPIAHVPLYGSVEYDETRQKTLSARFPGRIDRLFVDYTGIRVKKGDHLATVYSPELLTAQTELLTAKRFSNMDALRASRDKLRLWGFSDERISEIEASGKTSDNLTIDAPVSGIVTHKNVSEGDYVKTGDPLFRINDLAELWVVFGAYESDKPWLRFGQQVTFTAEALPGEEFEGQISFVAPQLDPATRTFAVRVNVENPDEKLKPGMFVRGTVEAKVAGAGRVIDPSLAGKWISPMHPEIVKDGPGKCDVCGMDLVPAEELGYTAAEKSGKPPLVVPASAVLHTGKRSVVYVEKTDADSPTYEGREILLGPRADDVYLVEAGLKEGDRVVTEGAFSIDSALQIQAQPSMMLPGEDEAPLLRQFEVPDDVLSQVDAILRPYFSLREALAADDFEKAKKVSESLDQQVGQSVATLPEEDAADAWAQVSESIRASAQSIANAEDIEAARTTFEPLSKSVEQLVRQFGTAELSVYRMHCPMAFGNKGADWLQETNKLRNPYFGDAMLTCGDVEEQIAGPVDE